MATDAIAVVGFGYWGPNVARVLRAAGADVVVIDEDASRREAAERLGYRTRAVFNAEASDVKAVAICTPPRTHYPLALAAIQQGKHVLVAKPLALSAHDADRLHDAATAADVALMVDHTFLYSPAVARLRREVHRRLAVGGAVTFYDSVRMNLGTTPSGESVIWDLGSHDVSIMLHVLEDVPVEVRTVTNGDHQAYIAYRFHNGFVAHSHLNWTAPAKVRRTTVGCTSMMVVYDDVSADEKIRVYEVEVGMDRMVDYRLGDVTAPALPTREALAYMVEAFEVAIRDRTRDTLAVDVVRVLAAAERAAETDDWVTV
jgi:predicted dehydrogenase